jgi:myo-inositol-1(or 4)-monophosphatase
MQNDFDLQKILRVAVEATKIGEKILTEFYGRLKSVNEKDQAGLVSEADLESERAIAQYLRRETPGTDILGEEGAYEDPGLRAGLKAAGRWVIDPLDGTTNYIHQFPIYCISIGFELNGDAVAGAINVPLTKKIYTATKGGGAHVNGERLRVSKREGISNSLMATGFSSYNKEALAQQLSIFSHVVSQARGVRRAGSAAIDLCMVAEGVFDGYWEKNLQAWDVCAGALIVKEAGGKVTDFRGNDFSTKYVDLVCGNPNIHGKLLDVIQTSVES